uniref:Uncharacterized protein n=1 Tax=viral metagenome TaxID=1070528 RepID=A0A6M3LZ75_9ZZZZ
MSIQAQQNLIFPISKWELEQIKKGKVATPHWHDVVEKKDIFCALVGFEIIESEYDELRKRGIHCLVCRLNKEAVKNIERGNVTMARFGVHSGTKVIIMMMMDYRAKKIIDFPNNVAPREGDIL